MPSPSPFYTQTGSLTDISKPDVALHSNAIPELVLRFPTASSLPILTAILDNPANTENDLSVSTLSPAARETLCRSWLTLETPLTKINFLVHHASQPIGISGIGWIGPANPRAADDGEGASSPEQPDGARAGAAGVVLNPEARGQGLAYEALRISVDYGLRELGLVEVRIGTPSENVAMRSLMERRFGMHPEARRERDRFGNDLLWRIGREKWLAENGGLD